MFLTMVAVLQIFNHCDVIGLRSYEFGEITQN